MISPFSEIDFFYMKRNSVPGINSCCTRWCFQRSENFKFTCPMFCVKYFRILNSTSFCLFGSPARVLLRWLIFSTLTGFGTISYLFNMRENPNPEIDARGHCDELRGSGHSSLMLLPLTLQMRQATRRKLHDSAILGADPGRRQILRESYCLRSTNFASVYGASLSEILLDVTTGGIRLDARTCSWTWARTWIIKARRGGIEVEETLVPSSMAMVSLKSGTS